MLSFFTVSVDASEDLGWSMRADTAMRFDYRSQSGPRYQYRLRAYPALQLDEHWSLNSFVVTGDEFAASYNTFNGAQAQHLHMRRLFARYHRDNERWEMGVLPTFKGRVSSTGLSKDGWVAGVRHVRQLSRGKLEFVIGEIDNPERPDVWDRFESVNYAEVEYSHEFDQHWSGELQIDHMFGSKFLRAELRYQGQHNLDVSAEWIHRVTNQQSKMVVNVSRDLEWDSTTYEMAMFYTYVNDDFGPRAELTEDFLEFGHALAAQLSGDVSGYRGVSWFTQLELYEGQQRFQLGMQARF